MRSGPLQNIKFVIPRSLSKQFGRMLSGIVHLKDPFAPKALTDVLRFCFSIYTKCSLFMMPPIL